ncbi:GyrI-like domain-containing protein [Halobacillus massiliensis]|uniref:GyrI-like domain-containing protein n=1 Tax=Halobacillus massiliensis TaxID=1926286 RepID=UPI0009E1B39F|nr:GyrI-like domain-containing protein [Halobacillus massiliensis]
MGVDKYQIVERPGYRAVGLKWEGAYSHVHTLKEVIAEVNERVKEFSSPVDPAIQLGLSYHLRPDGFSHYSVYEVPENEPVPEGMIEIYVPAMTCLMTSHEKGENIGLTYEEIYDWLKNNHYVPFEEQGTAYYDKLPIKHERYPADRDLSDPHFDILIPVTKL